MPAINYLFVLMTALSTPDGKRLICISGNYQNKVQTLRETTGYVIATKHYRYKSRVKDIAISVDYPSVTVSSDTTLTKAINHSIVTFFHLNNKSYYTEMSSEDFSSGYKYSIAKKQQIFSIITDNESYGHGAPHSWHFTESLNIDLTTGKRLSNNDLFTRDQLTALKNHLIEEVKIRVPKSQDALQDPMLVNAIIEDIRSDKLVYSFSDTSIVFYLRAWANGRFQFGFPIPIKKITMKPNKAPQSPHP